MSGARELHACGNLTILGAGAMVPGLVIITPCRLIPARGGIEEPNVLHIQRLPCGVARAGPCDGGVIG